MFYRFSLGTVQFGLDYGVSNNHGIVDLAEARNIVHYARENGIDTIDTAINYGSSELVLGKIGASNFNIISKLPPIPSDLLDVEQWVEDNVRVSIRRLKIRCLHGLLLHRPSDLLGPHGLSILSGLMICRKKNLIDKIGYSIYDPVELNQLVKFYQPDIIQAPFNVFDRRLVRSGWLKRLKDLNVEFHARSIFLQGLLLMQMNSRPEKFNKWNHLWCDWANYLDKFSLSPLEACVSDAVGHVEIDKIIIGVNSLQQIKQIQQISKRPLKCFHDFRACSELDLINPGRWNAL